MPWLCGYCRRELTPAREPFPDLPGHLQTDSKERTLNLLRCPQHGRLALHIPDWGWTCGTCFPGYPLKWAAIRRRGGDIIYYHGEEPGKSPAPVVIWRARERTNAG